MTPIQFAILIVFISVGIVGIVRWLYLIVLELKHQSRIQRLQLRKLDEIAMFEWRERLKAMQAVDTIESYPEPFRIPNDLIKED